MTTPAAVPRAPTLSRPRLLRTIAGAAYWLAAPLFCFVLYNGALRAWFQADDFAWLALRLDVHDWRSLLHALFDPMAQGSVRPLSERAFFLVLPWLFGPSRLPFHLCVFLTQCANLTLLTAITRRITGSPAAGFWAGMLWIVNSGLVVPMIWISAYNQVLCAFFVLGAFWFLLRYLETGRTRDYVWQWVVFLAGFGALEINAVYPALAALYTFLFARRRFRSTLLLFIPSAVFVWLHAMLAPLPITGAYALHFDSIPGTLMMYWRWALISSFFPLSYLRFATPLLALLSVGILAFTIIRARQRDWLPVFWLSWFVVVLLPYLPFRDHIMDYFLPLPTAGVAMLGAYAVVHAWSRPFTRQAAVAGVLTAYILAAGAVDLGATRWWRDRSFDIERMVMATIRARQLHPGKTILLDGVDEQRFWAGVFHYPFRVFGVSDVYLTPGSEKHIEAHPETGRISDFVLPGGPTLHAIKNDQVVVYRIGFPMKAITSAYDTAAVDNLSPAPPRRVDAGSPLMAYLLGPEWYDREEGHRWMPKRATLRIGGPDSPSQKLYLKGFIAELQLAQGVLPVRVTVDGVSLPEGTLQPAGSWFQIEFPLPEQAVGKRELEIAVEVGRTFLVGADTRPLGLNFGVFEIR
jgi:hypothetical protein